MDRSQDWIRDELARRGLLRISGGSPENDGAEGGGGEKSGTADDKKGGDGKGGGAENGGKEGDGKGDAKPGDDGKNGAEGEASFKPPKDQDEFDRMVADRLARQKASITAEIRAELKAEADLKAAEEQGNYKALYEAEQAKNAKLAQEAKEREHQERRDRIAAKFNIPADLAVRLQGETEADLEADAKKMAKYIKTQAAADTEAGKGRRSGGSKGGEGTDTGYQYGSGQAQVPWPTGVKTEG